MVGAETVEPMNLFQVWLEEAHETEVNDPTAMTLATVSAAGAPSARMVLLKEADDRGFVFIPIPKVVKARSSMRLGKRLSCFIGNLCGGRSV